MKVSLKLTGMEDMSTSVTSVTSVEEEVQTFGKTVSMSSFR